MRSLMSGRPNWSCGCTHQERVAWPRVSQTLVCDTSERHHGPARAASNRKEARTAPFPCRFFSHDPRASARTLPHGPRTGSRRGCSRRGRCTMEERLGESRAGGRPQHWGDLAVFTRFSGTYGTADEVSAGGCQPRNSGALASDSTRRTRSACRDRPCLANMCFTCERIVLSRRPVARAMSRTVLPSANKAAT